jgi:hypothetical protein
MAITNSSGEGIWLLLIQVAKEYGWQQNARKRNRGASSKFWSN